MKQIGEIPLRQSTARPDSNPECCGKCRFFMPMEDVNGADPLQIGKAAAPVQGLCLRYPPTGQVISMQPHPLNPKAQVPQVVRLLPQVNSPEWCGEFSLEK